jgi:hypothetical protein
LGPRAVGASDASAPSEQSAVTQPATEQAALGSAGLPMSLIVRAAEYYGRERWPECRVLSVTPYYAFDGSVNAYAVQLAKKGSRLPTEAGAERAMTAAEVRLNEIHGILGDGPSSGSGSVSQGAQASRIETMEDGSAWRRQLRAAQNAAVLPDDVGTVLIAAREDLYPLLERHDGVAPHLKFKSKAKRFALAEGKNPAALGRTFYVGPTAYFHELAVPGKMNGPAVGKVLNPLSEEIFDLDQRRPEGRMGRLAPAPNGKNAVSPNTFWDSFRAKGTPPNADANTPMAVPQAEILGVPYYHQDDYGANSCVPTATAQVLGYWDDNGYGAFVDNGDSVNGHEGELIYDLMRRMAYGYDRGTTWWDFLDGLSATISGYLYYDYPHDPLAWWSYQGWLSWGDIKGEIWLRCPFVYDNKDLDQYPKWKHSTTGVGYSETSGHILFLHYNYPPDAPFELNWDNIDHDKEAMCKIYPKVSAMMDVPWSEDFEAGIWDKWKRESKGATYARWWTTKHRSRNKTTHPYPPKGDPSHSAYCVENPVHAPGPYPKNVDSWMIYGPFSTLGKSSGDVSVWIWRDIPDDPGDYIWILASTDGVNFAGIGYSGVAKSWTRHAYDLANFPVKGNLLNQSKVWVAIRFESDGDDLVGEGAYVDDFLIQLKPVTPMVVRSPEAGKIWMRGETRKIQWLSVGDLGNGLVKLDLYKGGAFKTGIALMEPNDGQFDWTLPKVAYLQPGKDYRVKVEQVVGPVRSGMSEDFEIRSDTGFNLLTPNGDEKYHRGGGQIVKWSWYGYPGNQVSIFLMKGGSTNRQIAYNAPNNGSFGWTIPSNVPVGSDYKVKITAVNSGGIVQYWDESDAPFQISEKLAIYDPSYGVWMEKLQTHDILWATGTGTGRDVQIDLYQGRTITPIIGSTPNDGLYSWTLADSIQPTSHSQIRITSLADPAEYAFSEPFRILDQPGLGVLSPNGDEWWIQGSPHDITWVSSLAVKRPVKIELYKGALAHTTITSSTADTGSFNWIVPESLPPDFDYRVRVALAENDAVNDSSDLDFAVVEPGVRVLAPNGGELLRPETTYTIAWDTVGIGRSDMRIELYRQTELQSVLSSATANTGEFVWTLPASQPSASDYFVKVSSVADPRRTDASDSRFAIQAPPGITLLTPNGGESFLQSHRYRIAWTSRGIPASSVLLELYEGNQPTTVAMVSLFPGWFDWRVTPLNPAGSDYRIKITSLWDSSYSDQSDAPFQIEPYAGIRRPIWPLYY